MLKPPGLEGRHDRLAECEAVGFNLRLVLAVEVRIRIARELAADDLTVVRDGVDQLGVDEIVAAAAADRVTGRVRVDGDPVVARTAGCSIAAPTAADHVGACKAVDDIVAAQPTDNVRRGRAGQSVWALGSVDHARSRPTGDGQSADSQHGPRNEAAAHRVERYVSAV
jgi:hypothetical protein